MSPLCVCMFMLRYHATCPYDTLDSFILYYLHQCTSSFPTLLSSLSLYSLHLTLKYVIRDERLLKYLANGKILSYLDASITYFILPNGIF